MPNFEFTSPEGKKYTIEGPDGATKEQAFQMLQTHLSGNTAAPASAPVSAKKEPVNAPLSLGDAAIKYGQNKLKETRDLVAGGIRGAGSIGATIAVPYDMAVDAMAGKGLSLESNRARRASMDWSLGDMGADTESTAYGVGKVGAEIAGTLGVGGALGNGVVRAAPLLGRMGASAPTIANAANALTTGGFRAGSATGLGNAGLRAGAGAITGGASAGLINPEHAKTGAIIGGVLPGAATLTGKAGSFARKALTGGGASEEVKALAARAKELGIPIPADRLVDSKPLNALASSLNYVPLSGRASSEKAMESGLNRALSRTFGQNTDNVTLALRKAQDDLGAKFESVLKNNNVRVDDDLLSQLGEIERTANRELGQDGMRAIKGQIDELMEKGSTGMMDGQAAYNIKRTLDRIGSRSTPEAFHAREMKGALIEALNRSIGPEKAAAFALTRKQYGNMLALERVAKNGAEGDISVARLANMKNINNKELQELADISAQFVKAREGQHGAMQRVVLGTGGAVAAMTGAPVVGLAAGVGAGRGANMLLNSNMARNAVMSQPGPTSEAANKLLQTIYRTAPVIPAR